MTTAAIWPALDYSRVPYRLYHDAEIYREEQARIFNGPVWNYLGLEAEIPEPGDCQPRRRRPGPRLRQPLRPSRRAGPARGARQRDEPYLHLSPMVLRARRDRKSTR